MSFIFWCREEGIAPAVCSHGLPNSRVVRRVDSQHLETDVIDLRANLYQQFYFSYYTSLRVLVEGSYDHTGCTFTRVGSISNFSMVVIGHTFKADPLSISTFDTMTVVRLDRNIQGFDVASSLRRQLIIGED
jgi:hypothetical protein